MSKHILYIISDVDSAPYFENISSTFSLYKDSTITFCFISHSLPASASILQNDLANVYFLKASNKTDWFYAFFKLCFIIFSIRPDIVHCHLLKASVIGLLASFFIRTPSRIFTRHHGGSHHFSQRRGLIWDHTCNLLSTNIISISSVTTRILHEWEKVPLCKIVYIPHGISKDTLSFPSSTNIANFREKYNIPHNKRIIGVISRFESGKGLRYLLEAFVALQARYPDIHLLMLNAFGPDLMFLQPMLSLIPFSARTIIKYDPDVSSAYALMSIFVHIPVDLNYESFGQVYVEAASARVPIVCTLSGIAPSFIRHYRNALVVPYRDARATADSISLLLDNPSLCSYLVKNCESDIKGMFSVRSMCEKLHALYHGRPYV